MNRPAWEEYALLIAETAAVRSQDPWRKVGACLLRHDRSVLSVGYNGPPPSVEIDWTSRETRRDYVTHAEVNALRWARPGEIWLLASTSLPCQRCMLEAAAYGVEKIVYRDELDASVYDTPAILDLAEAAGIVVTKGLDAGQP